MKTKDRIRGGRPRGKGAALLLPALLPVSAHASFLPPELMDAAATYIA